MVHSELIQEAGRVTRLRAAVQVAGQATHHHEVVPAADRGVTRHQSLRLREAPAQDPQVEVAAVALQAKGNSRQHYLNKNESFTIINASNSDIAWDNYSPGVCTIRLLF